MTRAARAPGWPAAALAATLVACLSGCASQDPRTDDFFGGFHGIVSGDYAKREQYEQQRLLVRQAEADKGAQQSAALEQSVAEREARNAELRQQVQALRGRLAALRQEAVRLRAKRSDLAADIDAKRGELEQTQAELDRLRAEAATATDTSALEKRRKELEDEITRLREYFRDIERSPA